MSRIQARQLALLAIILLICGAAQPALAGCQWQQLKTPNPGNAVNELNGVRVFYTGNVWEVGDSSSASNGPYQDVIDHWNGSSWSTEIVGTAPLTQLLSVSGQDKNSVWTVGYATSTTDQSTAFPIALHFDGTSWVSTTPVIMGGWAPSRFTAVAAIGSNNAWAVGFHSSSAGPQQLIEHWNGTKWVNFNIQQQGTSDLLAVTALARDNIYALGTWQVNGQSGTMVEHFNGQTWSTSLSTSDCLSTLTTLAPNDVFAAGACGGQTVIDVFNGADWSQMLGPAVDQSAVISGISARNVDAIFAVGRIPATGQAFSMFFNGQAWTQITVPNPNSNIRILNATDQSQGTNEFWAVGTSIPMFGMARAITLKPICV